MTMCPLLACAALFAAAVPDAPRPASVLVFPVHHASARMATLVTVTNTQTAPGGGTLAFYHYVNVRPEPGNPLLGQCSIFCRSELLTPADTLTVLTGCHNAGPATDGYLVVSAKSPTSGAAWGHDWLIGSQVVIDFATGAVYGLQPLPFEARVPAGAPTDVNGNGRIDFDGVEYELLPDDLHLDSFLGAAGARLVLLDLSGDREAVVSVNASIWNDNEFPLSATFRFRCWFELELARLSSVFTQSFLAGGTPHDEDEVDIDCDGRGDLEAGWARISGVVATGGTTIPNPPLLGAIVGGGFAFEPGRVLWGSRGSSRGAF